MNLHRIAVREEPPVLVEDGQVAPGLALERRTPAGLSGCFQELKAVAAGPHRQALAKPWFLRLNRRTIRLRANFPF